MSYKTKKPLLLKAISVPMGYIAYYITRHNGAYYTFYDDGVSGIQQIGKSNTLHMCIYSMKYHLRKEKQVAFTTEKFVESFCPMQIYDFSEVVFTS